MKRRELRVVRGKRTFSFTIGAIVESLQGVGVPTDEAIAIARSLEKSYRDKDERDIELSALMRCLVGLVGKEVGAEVAARLNTHTPPFVTLQVEGDKGVGSFSRRELGKSLEKLGLDLKAASTVARQVEQRLRLEGYETVAARDLTHLVAVTLEAIGAREVRLRYESEAQHPTDILVTERGGVQLPYSRGILAQSLLAVGIGPSLAHTLAKETEDALWRKRELEVSSARLREVTRGLLEHHAGEEFARRYELMRSVRHPDRPIIVLIGGVSGVGKSTLAAEVAYRLGILRIVSCDSIRQALRSLISAELSPSLHSSSFSAWRSELLPDEEPKPKRKRVVRGFQLQVQQLNTALSAIMHRAVEERTSLVMEGIHIVPGFMAAAARHEATVVEVVLHVPDVETHRGHFKLRGSQTHHRPGDRYLDHFAEIRILQGFVVAQARREGVEVIDGSDLDKAAERAIELVLDAVLAEQVEHEDPPEVVTATA